MPPAPPLKPCHSVRAGILAHYGHYGSQLSFSGASAVGRRISKHCAARKSFHEGFVTDWNPVTWRHQVLYGEAPRYAPFVGVAESHLLQQLRHFRMPMPSLSANASLGMRCG